ncbi:MAG: hypothetical protein ACF8NJ_06005 [Phycisphaerales bacterium JB038]
MSRNIREIGGVGASPPLLEDLLRYLPPRGWLEQEARYASIERLPPDEDALVGLQREIDLILDHLAEERLTTASVARSLIRCECYVSTELMAMEQRTPKYSPYRFPEREKLHRRLFQIEQERRKLAVEHSTRSQALRDRLLTLLNRRRLLSLDGP